MDAAALLDGALDVPALRLALGAPGVAWRLMTHGFGAHGVGAAKPCDPAMIRFMRGNGARPARVAPSAEHALADPRGVCGGASGVRGGAGVHAPSLWRHVLGPAAAAATAAGLGASAAAATSSQRPALALGGPLLPVPPPPRSLPTDMERLPRISDLLRQHRARIDAVRASPALEGRLGKEHDDLFVLRYVLTHERSAAAAAEAIRAGLDWRAGHAELFTRLDAVQAEAREISPLGLLPWRTAEGQPVQVAVPCAANTEALVAKPDRWHIEAGVSNRELAFQLTDRLTRESGRLVRLVVVEDLAGLSLPFALAHRRLGPVQGRLSRLTDVLYPQLIETVVVVHPPPFADVLHRMGRSLLSERLMSKITLAHSPDALCAAVALPSSHLPSFLGGEHPWRPTWLPAGRS